MFKEHTEAVGIRRTEHTQRRASGLCHHLHQYSGIQWLWCSQLLQFIAGPIIVQSRAWPTCQPTFSCHLAEQVMDLSEEAVKGLEVLSEDKVINDAAYKSLVETALSIILRLKSDGDLMGMTTLFDLDTSQLKGRYVREIEHTSYP